MNPRILPALLLAITLVSTTADAQKASSKYYEDAEYGYKVKYPKDWATTPVQEMEKEAGVLVRFRTDFMTRVGSNTYKTPGVMSVVWVKEKLSAPSTGGGGLKDRVTQESGRGDVAPSLQRLVLSGMMREFDPSKPTDEEKVDFKKSKFEGVQHRTWEDQFNGNYNLMLDVWSYPMDGGDLNVIFEVPEDVWKKHKKVFGQIAKSLTRIEKAKVESLNRESSYEEILEFHRIDAEKAEGWRVLATPSKRYVIKTNSHNRKFLDEVIERVEMSRDLFEEEYPPQEPLEHVSVVRVFAEPGEFHKYGNTSPGVAGWFSPRTTELVLYDAVDVDRNMVYAVMTHEAFHQYCHFLFGQSEAHRWFDEGHGDFYGAFEFKRGRAIPGKKMPAGLDRVSEIKQMFRDKSYKPLSEHLFYNHSQWQSQGPSNVSCYAQSWSIIYFLRLGARGKVSSKMWKDEYADILPNYTQTLKKGFADAYAEVREAIEADAKEKGKTVTPGMLEVNRFSIDESTKQKIWKDAMEAAFGSIDLDEFQKDWEKFVESEV